MKKLTTILLSLCLSTVAWAFKGPVTHADSISYYYETIDGKSGKTLLFAIQQVAKKGYRTEDFRYDSCWFAFKYTDMTDDGHIWEIYGGCTFEYEKDRTNNTIQTDECKGYNREHAMCQSWFGEVSLAGTKMSSSKKNSPGSDIFHIYPAAYGMNSRRGNRPFGEVQTATHISDNGTKYGAPVTTISVSNTVAGSSVVGRMNTSPNVLEPADEYKGDIARSYFGTMVKWAGEWAFNKNEQGCVIFDATIDADTHYGPENNYGLTDYGLALMLKWHRQDPVSKKEVDRNNGIQFTQGNRNPFIDYPYLAEYIWGEKSGDVLDFDMLLCSADKLFELGKSNGYLGESASGQVDTVFWMVGDKVYYQSYVYHGGMLRNMPSTPESCSTESDYFIGWTSSPIVGMTNAAPAVLYKEVADFPAISSNTRYYAVFAEKELMENPSRVITLNKSDSTDWKLSGVMHASNNTDGAYWLLVKNANITSPKVDLTTLDSVALIFRSYHSKKTIAIMANGVNVGQVTASTNTMQRYTWSAPELTGNHALQFTSTDGTDSYGPGIKEIQLYLEGDEKTYTNYISHCTLGPTTELNQPYMQSNVQKIIQSGNLYICVEGQLYDGMGRVVKQ